LLEIGEPRLNLTTPISNSDQEEKIAALLHSQGCNIIHRALNIDSLTTFLVSNNLKVNRIYTPDFVSKAKLKELSISYPELKLIQLTEDLNSQELLTQLAQISRPPLLHQLARANNLIAVLGTPGSPGISTITNHLAVFKSAQVIAAAHHNLRPQRRARVEIISASQLDKKLAAIGSSLAIIDAGASVELTKTISDRRMNAIWLSHSLTCAGNLIYILSANDNGISYLTEFISDFRNLLNPPPIFFVLNQQRFDRMGQSIQRKFLEIAGNYPSFQIPYVHRSIRSPADATRSNLFWRSTTFNMQIQKIGNQLSC
jgi:predicted DNA-binding protein (UPF0251 family)